MGRAILAGLLMGTGLVQAGGLYLPNASFESPTTDFADPRIDGWQKSPQPDWWDPSAASWDQLSGVFANTAPGSSDSIVNCDGAQAAFLFALPGVALFQDYNSTDWADPVPTHAFDAKFTPGLGYALKVGVIGGGGGMKNGATLELSLYYRDAASNVVTVAATSITNSPTVFSNTTQFVEFQVVLPAVRTNDAWANQNIGVQILSTVGFDQMGGYWDLDNARLSETLEIPNGSFEEVATDFADPRVDAWQKSPQPDWWDPSVVGSWDQLSGVFANPAPESADHIVNCDGAQAAFLFALPQVALFQDYNSMDWASSSPTHEFNARFKPGQSYTLTVGVIGGGGGMNPGATLELSLYYRDAVGNIVIVAATTVTHTPAVFSNTTHLVDFQVSVPTVRASDPWANQNIGVLILSTVGIELPGGYWGLDNVRLAESRQPSLVAQAPLNGQMRFTLQSDPGAVCEVLAATHVTLPRSQWTLLETLTNVTGTNTVSDATTTAPARFYQVRQLP